MVSWKTFWVTLAATVSLVVAGALVLFRASLWWCVPGLVPLIVLCAAVAARIIHGSDMFKKLPERVRVQILRSLVLAIVIHAVWIAIFVARVRQWPVWVVALLALALLEFGLAHAHEYLLTRVAPRPRKVRPDIEPVQTATTPTDGPQYSLAAELDRTSKDKTLLLFKAGVAQAGFGWLRVSSQWRPVHDFGVQFFVQVPSSRALEASKTSKDSRTSATTFGFESAEPLAVGLQEVLGHGLKTDWIAITKQEFAGSYGVLVTTTDTMDRLYPFEDTPAWTSLEEPALAGYGRDAEPHFLNLAQHGQEIGASRSGKTSLIHNKIGHVTRCADAVQWVCGVEKLYDLVAGWIEPYRGHRIPLPIDWIAYGQADVLNMLVAGMNIARWRQRVPLALRRNWPKIVITLDEASFALRNRTLVAEYDGAKYTAAQLVAMLAQGALSGGVIIDLATQRSTNDHFGDQGGDTSAQLAYTAAFRTRDQGEIGRLVGNYRLSTPLHAGSFWLVSGAGDLPVLLKAPYIQEVDPARPLLHNGLTVSDVSWARRNFHVELDEGSIAAAGPAYAARHRYMTPELEEYLTGMTLLPGVPGAAAGMPMSDAAKRGYDAVMASLRQVGNDVAEDRVEDAVPTGTTSVSSPLTVVSSLPQGSRQDHIIEALTQHGPMVTREIVEALTARGYEVRSYNAVTNLLSSMVADGALSQSGRGGTYSLPGLSVVSRVG